MSLVGKILRGARFALLALVLLYGGDYVSARYRLPSGRQTLGSVDVQLMWAIKQKNGRIDYELGDTETRPCLYSLFPHLGYTQHRPLIEITDYVLGKSRTTLHSRLMSEAQAPRCQQPLALHTHRSSLTENTLCPGNYNPSVTFSIM